MKTLIQFGGLSIATDQNRYTYHDLPNNTVWPTCDWDLNASVAKPSTTAAPYHVMVDAFPPAPCGRAAQVRIEDDRYNDETYVCLAHAFKDVGFLTAGTAYETVQSINGSIKFTTIA